jgi:predicted glycosyltransferase
MNIFIDFNHPKDVNIFKNVIAKLSADGHNIRMVASDKENILAILDSYELEYSVKPHYKGLLNKVIGMFKNDYLMWKIAKEFNPDIFASFGSPFAAQVSKLVGKKHISFSDTDMEVATINQFAITTLLFSEVDYIPSCHRIERKKQKKIDSYYELSYLHPNYFTPNLDILKSLNLDISSKYILVRLASLNAHHDIGAEGFNFANNDELLNFIEKLSGYAKVYLTTEIELPEQFDCYRLNIPPEEFHNFLFYSSLYIGEGASIAAEAAILGVPSIYVSNTTRGYLEELEHKYGLAFTIKNKDVALDKAIELLGSDLKAIYAERRVKMLSDKIDVAKFMAETIEKEL